MKQKKQFKLNLPLELFSQLKVVSARESRSITSQINLMLRRQLEDESLTEPKCSSTQPREPANISVASCGKKNCFCARNIQKELARVERDG